MSSIGISGSATYAVSLSGIEEMMTYLPDNLTNDITARKARDVVFTLYDELQGLSSSTFFYSNPNPITNPIGNWKKDGTFSNVTLKEIFDKLFYIDSGPGAGISVNPPTLDFGNTQNVSISWNITKGTYNFNASSFTITRSTSPTKTFTIAINPSSNNNATFSDTPQVNVTNSYSFKVFDTKGNEAPASTSIGYSNRWYYGNILDNLTVMTSSQIRQLNSSGSGAFASGPRGFSKNFTSVNDIGGGNRYMAWAFPSSWDIPVFRTTGGLPWTGPTFAYKIAYTNVYNYTEDYDVYITQSPYVSVYNQFIIS